jgi:hypothetical protein
MMLPPAALPLSRSASISACSCRKPSPDNAASSASFCPCARPNNYPDKDSKSRTQRLPHLQILEQLLLRLALTHHRRNVPLNLHQQRHSKPKRGCNLEQNAHLYHPAARRLRRDSQLCENRGLHPNKNHNAIPLSKANIAPASVASALESSASTSAWAAAAASRAASALLRAQRAPSRAFVSDADWSSISAVTLVVWGCIFGDVMHLQHWLAAEIIRRARLRICRLKRQIKTEDRH